MIEIRGRLWFEYYALGYRVFLHACTENITKKYEIFNF